MNAGERGSNLYRSLEALRHVPVVMILPRERPVRIRFHKLQAGAQARRIFLLPDREWLHVSIPEIRLLVRMCAAKVLNREAVQTRNNLHFLTRSLHPFRWIVRRDGEPIDRGRDGPMSAGRQRDGEMARS